MDAVHLATDPCVSPPRIPLTETQMLVATIARKHRLTPADLTGRSRRVKVFAARREAVLTVKAARPDMSAGQLGRIFHRDPSTIRFLLRKAGV